MKRLAFGLVGFLLVFTIAFVTRAGPITDQKLDLNKRFRGSITGQAAALAGLSTAAAVSNRTYFITNLTVQTTTATSGTYAIQAGTGTNCADNTTAVFPSNSTSNRYNAPIASSAAANFIFDPPLIVYEKQICLIGTATNTISADIAGYYAP